ncbi:hypothetical protein LPJ79_002432 [Coemansia sp. RSA 1821]|nr:hypothetical protein LPJ68_002820 [Coemansia sp. RSA 1086]KAJ1751022.1 hypothetical protein LPJ79_002432 [Coemansia sp. RSA 1821]KAJ2652152.1 hypothetical protein IWW40_001349 [Coemansia sp. RSA 1250]KAJ2675101.1 hypothetical protein IWW42_001247 [Coemansia sp. RSA 1085]
MECIFKLTIVAGSTLEFKCNKNTKLRDIPEYQEWPSRVSTENLVFVINNEYYPADSLVAIGELAGPSTHLMGRADYGELLTSFMFGESQGKKVLVNEATTFKMLKEMTLLAYKLNVDPTKYKVRFNLLRMKEDESVLEHCYPFYDSAYFCVSKC